MSSEIVFTLDIYTWTPGCGRVRPVSESLKLGVVVAQSEGGQIYAYAKGVNVQPHEFDFVQLTLAKATELRNWFQNICQGPLYPFIFTDEDGVSHVVRWIDTEFAIEEVSPDVYRAKVNLREEVD